MLTSPINSSLSHPNVWKLKFRVFFRFAGFFPGGSFEKFEPAGSVLVSRSGHVSRPRLYKAVSHGRGLFSSASVVRCQSVSWVAVLVTQASGCHRRRCPTAMWTDTTCLTWRTAPTSCSRPSRSARATPVSHRSGGNPGQSGVITQKWLPGRRSWLQTRGPARHLFSAGIFKPGTRMHLSWRLDYAPPVEECVKWRNVITCIVAPRAPQVTTKPNF